MAKKKLYKVWCEWDMGMGWEDKVFSTEKKALDSIKQAPWDNLEEGETYEVLIEEGLLGIEEVNYD